MSCTTGARYVI